MKKWEKEILQKQIQDEAKVTTSLEKIYKQALQEVNDKIQVLMSKEQTQSVIYQLRYQQELEKQLSEIYGNMSNTFYGTIDDYLTNCYEDSFYSTMYGIHQEGIPTVIPFDQKQAAQMAAQSPYSGIKLSQKLYGNNTIVALNVRTEITKGIAMNSSYADITRRVAAKSEASVNQAYRIVRTEGHRIQNEVKFKTINKVKDESGADIVKQWDATIDKRTRPDHVALDGQLREIDQPFKTPSGKTALYPGGFGIAKEDINCRCVCLQRARWALDKSELDKVVGDLDGATEEQLEAWAQKLGVSKADLIKSSNGIIEKDGSINHAIKAQNYNQFKKKYVTKAAQKKALQEAQQELDEVTKLQNSVSDAQNKLNGMQNKTYSGIWKDDVSLSDYKYKKGSIAAKRQYYLDQLSILDPNDPKYKQFKKYLDDLDEFESLGSKYLAAQKELEDLQQQLKALQGGGVQFSPDAYSDARKKAAKDFKSKSAADKFHRPYLDSKWDELSDKEKYSVWKYTENSNPMNKPLSGYEETWDRRNFRGVGNVKWSYEDGYRNNPANFRKFGHSNGRVDHFSAIKDLTTAIDKMEIPEDCFLVRGSGTNGLAGLLEGSNISFDQATKLLESGDIDTLKQLLEGKSFQSHSFMSTGIASGTGFSGEVRYKIYVPKGTHGIYAEPQSYYGDTHAFGDVLYRTGDYYSGISGEAEIILQRGTTYRITKIEKEAGYYRVEMEVVEQPDYFKTGAEETFNNGATIHKD